MCRCWTASQEMWIPLPALPPSSSLASVSSLATVSFVRFFCLFSELALEEVHVCNHSLAQQTPMSASLGLETLLRARGPEMNEDNPEHEGIHAVEKEGVYKQSFRAGTTTGVVVWVLAGDHDSYNRTEHILCTRHVASASYALLKNIC